MTEATTEIPVNQQQSDNAKFLDSIIEKVNNNDFKIYFYCPPMNSPSGGIGVIFKQAKILKDYGFSPVIVYEPRVDNKMSYMETQKRGKKVEIFEPFKPDWLGTVKDGIKIQCLGTGEMKFNDNTSIKTEALTINPEDFMIIPEGFPNIMQKFSQIPCKKIVFAQSWFYILNAMHTNQTWQQFGIRDVISISQGITKYLNAVMPGLDIKEYSQSIDRTLFKPKPITEKLPKIAYMPGRTMDAILKTQNIIKTFYLIHPHYRWIRFDELKDLSKEDFADRLAECALALYTDEIAGFGTMPLEAMACGTHVVGWIPLGSQEYIQATNGFWAHNGDIFEIVDLLAMAVERYLNSLLDNKDVEEEYEKTLERYTPENEKQSIINIYNTYKNERISELQQLK